MRFDQLQIGDIFHWLRSNEPVQEGDIPGLDLFRGYHRKESDTTQIEVNCATQNAKPVDGAIARPVAADTMVDRVGPLTR